MAIRGNIGSNVLDLGAAAADVSVLNTGSDRMAVTGFSIFNTTASTSLTVDIYESPNATSASGKKVASYSIAGNASADVVECIGQGYGSTRQLVCVVTTGGATSGQLNAKVTYTLYSAGS